LQDLRAGQLQRALDAVLELQQIGELAEFPQRVSQTLRGVIACHHAGYTAVELGSGRATVSADPPESVFDGGPEVFARFAHQNPLLANLARTGETSARRLSDFMTRRELHATELYDYVYRRIPLEYQLGVPLASPRHALGRPDELVGLSLARVERDFTDADLALVDLLRPHLASMLERLHELALLRAIASAGDSDASRWLVLVEESGVVAWATPAAADALGLTVGELLPHALLGWLASASGARLGGGAAGERPGEAGAWSPPLTVEAISLQVRFVGDAYPGLHALHLRSLRPRPTLAALQALGLTERQAQVMQLALTGRTSREVAAMLRLSSRTVEKHMEAIYTRLGAANRTEAVAIAARALEP
jgi:DNA-binding CsgD family transcriptional regulator